MNVVQSLIQCVQKTEHGFIDIQKASEEIFASYSAADTLSFLQSVKSVDKNR